jgi:hypothetical protein
MLSERVQLGTVWIAKLAKRHERREKAEFCLTRVVCMLVSANLAGPILLGLDRQIQAKSKRSIGI